MASHQKPATIYYAHSRAGCGRDHWERLECHLRRTGALARRFAGAFGAGSWGAASGLLHDVGKYSEEFQARLSGDPSHVDHSTGGAIQAEEKYGSDYGHLLGYGIAGHHAGLPDGGRDDGATLLSRLKSNKVPAGHGRWKEAKIRIPDRSRLDAELTALLAPIADPDSFQFSLAFFGRMVFSALVDADYRATEWFLDRGRSTARRRRFPPPAALAQMLREHLDRTFGAPTSDVDRQRAAILQACRAAGKLDPGVFSLQVPTGGGKSLSSLSFGLEHAARNGLRRVIYAIPYTSIIEQTADVFRHALAAAGDDVVLEHHSAAEPPPEDGDEPIGPLRLRLATENWDAPVVVTTTVQLFESLFAARPRRCRKLHNLARSVIVLDEVQALPYQHTTPCLAALRELAIRYGSTIVLCSATTPAFDGGIETAVHLPKAQPIVAPSIGRHPAFRRVMYLREAEPLSDGDLVRRLSDIAQVLCIVDARRHAAELFDLLPDDGSRFHLSAAMCPAHRRAVLAEAKDRLALGVPCRVIATRVIEAGVDVSFPEVWRATAGIDSLAQAAGRCNRNGEQPDGGRFMVFDPERADAIPPSLTDLVWRAREARDLLREGRDPLEPETVEEFFKRLFARDASAGKKSQDAAGAYRRLNDDAGLDYFPYRSVAADFRMIDDASSPLIVPWDDTAKELIGEIENALRAPEPRRLPLPLLRRLQAYTVSCYGVERLVQSGHARALDQDGRFRVLTRRELYGQGTGLRLNGSSLRDPEFNIL